jgi:hypothetical protein
MQTRNEKASIHMILDWPVLPKNENGCFAREARRRETMIAALLKYSLVHLQQEIHPSHESKGDRARLLRVSMFTKTQRLI